MLSKLKKGGSADMPRTVEEATSGSPGYPKDYAVGSLRERRLLMSLRAVSFGLFGMTAVCLVQTFLLVSLAPLKEVRPFLVQVSDSGSVASSIKPIQDTFEAKDALTLKLVREYVTNRHEILRSDEVMKGRWNRQGYLGTTTEQTEFNRFAASVSETLEKLMKAGIERRVTIKSVNAVSSGSIYHVDFVSHTYDQRGDLIESRPYTATVEIDFRALKDLTQDQMLINPTGFTVVYFSLAEKEQ